jgi:ubiquinone/menaquinone biosynthesis C-methylase UbiE
VTTPLPGLITTEVHVSDEKKLVPALRYHALTRYYDAVVAATLRERVLRERLIVQADPRPGERILDLGCGSGTLAVRLRERAPEAAVVGLDGDPEILARARAKAASAGVEVGFELGLAGELPFADGAFDKVVSSLFFHHLAPLEKVRALREAWRVLRPGGELHVADWGRPASAPASVLFFSIQLLDGFESTRQHRRGELLGLVAAAGFDSVLLQSELGTIFGTVAYLRASRSDGVRSIPATVGRGEPDLAADSTTGGAV